MSVARLFCVECLSLTVRAWDAIDTSPVLALEPYMAELAPRGLVLGTQRLMGPSRTQPGIWHLVLFGRITGECPRVTALDDDDGLPMGAARG